MKKKIIFCLLSLSLMIAGCQSNEIEDITPPSKEVSTTITRRAIKHQIQKFSGT